MYLHTSYSSADQTNLQLDASEQSIPGSGVTARVNKRGESYEYVYKMKARKHDRSFGPLRNQSPASIDDVHQPHQLDFSSTLQSVTSQ